MVVSFCSLFGYDYGLFRWLSGLFLEINITFDTYNEGISDSLKGGQYFPVIVVL